MATKNWKEFTQRDNLYVPNHLVNYFGKPHILEQLKNNAPLVVSSLVNCDKALQKNGLKLKKAQRTKDGWNIAFNSGTDGDPIREASVRSGASIDSISRMLTQFKLSSGEAKRPSCKNSRPYEQNHQRL